MEEPTYTEEIFWKGTRYILKFFKTHDFSKISPKRQVSAVCFTDNEHVVFFQHVDGYLGLPGGTIEKDEKLEQALRREVMEESTCEIKRYGPIGYFKSHRVDDPDDFVYQLRYWAEVDCLEETPDPDGKAMHRVIVPYEQASEKLGWGERGKYLIELARTEYTQAK